MVTKTKRNRAHQKYVCQEGPYAGQEVPGVTTVLNILNKPALVPWAWGLGMKGLDYRKVRDQAADIGTIAHSMIEADIRGEAFDPSEYAPADVAKAEVSYIAWLDWRKANIVDVLHSELQMVSEEYGFGGTIDCIARHNGDVWLVDVKTGKAVYDEMIAQVAAYQVMYGDRFGHIGQVHIIRLDKEDGIFTDHQIPERKLVAGWDLFLHALGCYRALRELKR
jgi:hypothetical protein